MSLFAGVISRSGTPIPTSVSSDLHSAISRNPDDERVVFQAPGIYLVKVDIGAYEDSAFRIDPVSGSVAMLAGEPLFRFGQTSRSRSADLESVQESLDRGQSTDLALATGIFALVHFSPSSGCLTFATDKLGLRPVYWWLGDDYLVFATALRILEHVAIVPKVMDVLGVNEISVFEYFPSNDRTPFADIKRLRSAEMVTVQGGTVQAGHYYWDWRKTLEPATDDPTEVLAKTHDLFMTAIKRRVRSDVVVPACLSGGLDSRCVVDGLRSLNVDVFTFNYYTLLDSQDCVFAARFAEVAGTHHTAMPLPIWEAGTSFEQQLSAAWFRALEGNGKKPKRTHLLWTGDGGTVGLGHLHITPSIVADVRAGRFERALIDFRHGHLTSSILKPELQKELAELMVADFREQLLWAGCNDLGRAFYLYAIRNHQRNDFTQHFEHLDEHRMEFQSPFYDSDFIASLLPLPVEDCIGHKFYHKWLRLFPRAASVPWQSYPGHEPCHHPVPDELASEWDERNVAVRTGLRRRNLVKNSLRTVSSRNFPEPILRRNYLRLATFLHWAHLKNCQSALLTLELFQRYWMRSNGQYRIRLEAEEREVTQAA